LKTWTLFDFARQTMIAAIYAVLVYIFSFASFGLIQFRVAEVLMILVFFDRKSVVGLTIGVFVSSLIYGAIPLDLIFGPIATALAGLAMIMLKKKPILAMIFPALFNGIIIGYVLTYGYQLGLLNITIPSVFLGEFAVLYILGLPLYLVLRKHRGFLEFFDKQ
jgi:uncharacterized membrane protein